MFKEFLSQYLKKWKSRYGNKRNRTEWSGTEKETDNMDFAKCDNSKYAFRGKNKQDMVVGQKGSNSVCPKHPNKQDGE